MFGIVWILSSREKSWGTLGWDLKGLVVCPGGDFVSTAGFKGPSSIGIIIQNSH